MQTKLHRWAGDDGFRRFGDLFNLVYDSAFLRHAWERVSTNTGARTAGIDQATTAWVETRVGVEVFLGQIRQALKSGAFVPVKGAAGDDPQRPPGVPEAGDPHHR
jgi:RNA-directed DNA polymerase